MPICDSFSPLSSVTACSVKNQVPVGSVSNSVFFSSVPQTFPSRRSLPGRGTTPPLPTLLPLKKCCGSFFAYYPGEPAVETNTHMRECPVLSAVCWMMGLTSQAGPWWSTMCTHGFGSQERMSLRLAHRAGKKSVCPGLYVLHKNGRSISKMKYAIKPAPPIHRRNLAEFAVWVFTIISIHNELRASQRSWAYSKTAYHSIKNLYHKIFIQASGKKKPPQTTHSSSS